MKKLLNLIVLLLAITTCSAQVKVLGGIVPNGTTDTYPTHTDSLGRGGLMAVKTWQERNAIPLSRRKAGMLVRVKSLTVDSTYTIGGALANTDWIPFLLGGDVDVSGKEDKYNKVNNIVGGSVSNVQYPSTQAVFDFVNNTALTSANLKNNLSVPSDMEAPSTQAVVNGLNAKLAKAIPVTYAQFTDLVNSNSLVAEQSYLMTDYQTIHAITNATSVINAGPIEPLLITARTNNTFYPVVNSILHPEDLITYTLDNQRSSTKGFILKRVDTKKNVTMPYDFRYVKYRRWKLNPTTWSNIGFNIGNVVQYNNKIYYCLNTHATGSNPETSPAQWKEIMQNNDLYLGHSAANVSITLSAATGGTVTIPYNSADFIDTVTFPDYNNAQLTNIIYDTYNFITSNLVVFTGSGNRFRDIKFDGSLNNSTIALSGNYWMYFNKFYSVNNLFITGANTGTGSVNSAFTYNNLSTIVSSIINAGFVNQNNIDWVQQSIIGKNFSYNNGRHISFAIIPATFSSNTFKSFGVVKLSSDALNFTGNNFTGNVGLVYNTQAGGTARVWTVSQNLVDKTFIGATISDADSPNALADATTQSTIYVGAVTGADVNSKESLANKATSLTSPDNTKYPTTQAVSTALAGKQDAFSSAGYPYYNGTNTVMVNGSLNDIIRGDGVVTSGSPYVRSRNLMPFVPNNTPMADGITVMEGFNRAQGQIDNLSAVKEAVANKSSDLTSPNNTKYPTTLAVSTALSGKANDAEVVKLTGDQTITGIKTFGAISSNYGIFGTNSFGNQFALTPDHLVMGGGGYTLTVEPNITMSSNKSYRWPLNSGTLATTSDIPDISGKENVSNKAINLTSPDNTKYPTTLAVSTALSTKADAISLTNKANLTGGNSYTGTQAVTDGGIRVGGTDFGKITLIDNGNDKDVSLEFSPLYSNGIGIRGVDGRLGTLNFSALTSDKVYDFPNVNGTLATTDNVAVVNERVNDLVASIGGKASLGSPNTFLNDNVFNGQTIFGNSIIVNDGASVEKFKVNMNGSIRNVHTVPPTSTPATIAKFLTYAINPYGFVFRGYADGSHSIQVQRESNDSEYFPLSLNPNGGNVGVGINSPTEKLHVNGNIKANGVINANQVTVLRDGVDGATIDDGITVFKPDGLGETAEVGIRLYRGDITNAGNIASKGEIKAGYGSTVSIGQVGSGSNTGVKFDRSGDDEGAMNLMFNGNSGTTTNLYLPSNTNGTLATIEQVLAMFTPKTQSITNVDNINYVLSSPAKHKIVYVLGAGIAGGYILPPNPNLDDLVEFKSVDGTPFSYEEAIFRGSLTGADLSKPTIGMLTIAYRWSGTNWLLASPSGE